MINQPIKSDDPKALEKLQAKLQKLEEAQAFMKAANAYYRKHETMQGFPDITEAQAAALDRKVAAGYSWEKAPYYPYELSNNNAEIRRTKQRIEQLSQDRALGFVGWEFEGGEAVINTEKNRLQLVFDEKPNEEQRTTLKRNGFHWSPTEQAWQRQLNGNAIYAANRIAFIKPQSGERPSSLQPKAPKRDVPER